MGIQRQRWFKELRKIERESDRALDSVFEWEQRLRERPGLMYRFCLFIFCCVFSRLFVERSVQARALGDAMLRLEILEEQLARARSENAMLINNARQAAKVRARFDAARRFDAALARLAVPARTN